MLKEGIKEGRSIQEIELDLKDLPEFSRNRACVTAVTEVLTASSVIICTISSCNGEEVKAQRREKESVQRKSCAVERHDHSFG